MMLAKKNQCELVYCLTNTPEHIIANEIQKTTYELLKQPKYTDQGMTDAFSMAEYDAEQMILSQHKFDKIPKHKRVKRFIIERDDDLIQKICDRIEEARNVFDEIYDLI